MSYMAKVKHLRFKPYKGFEGGDQWDVYLNRGALVFGTVLWAEIWKRYCFVATMGSPWSPPMLRELADFLEEKNVTHVPRARHRKYDEGDE